MNNESIYKSPTGKEAIMALYDSVLARWPVPYEPLTLPSRYGDTYAIASGDESAPPLLLLHGAGSNSITWAGDVAAYSRHFRVFAVDLLGEPGKSAETRPAWDSPAYAEWLEDVLDALQLEKATLLGLSQGGWTALKFSVYRPERVEKLVLLTPGGIVPDKLSFLLRFIPLSLLGRWGRRRINQLLFAGQPIAEEVDDGMALIMRHFKSRMGTLPLFTDAELQRLQMPVLLLIGDKDVLRDAEAISARLQTLLPRLTTIIIPGAGHALVDTTGRVLPWLASSSKQRSAKTKQVA
jgi:pimeloyl-ACP methyl ester carboxylesterase